MRRANRGTVIRKFVTVGVAVAAMTLSLVDLGGRASAASAPLLLTLGQSEAFAI